MKKSFVIISAVVSLFVCLTTTPAVQAFEVFPPADNVLAYFEFNGDAKDSSGNGRDAVLLGGEFINTDWGKGLRIKKSEPQPPVGLDWNKYAALLKHPYTVEMLLTPTDTGDQSDWFKIFGWNDVADAGWYYKNNGIQAYPNDTIGDGKIPSKTRMYLAFVSTGKNMVDVYYNGTKLGSTASSFTEPPASAIFFRDDSTTARGEQLDGTVEALRISNVSRSVDEITAQQKRLDGRVVADISANGSARTISIDKNGKASIKISLHPVTKTGQSGDWWILASTPGGVYSLVASPTLGWVQGVQSIIQAPLQIIPDVEIPALPATSSGDYTYYFAVDLKPNATIDMDSLAYGSVTVQVK